MYPTPPIHPVPQVRASAIIWLALLAAMLLILIVLTQGCETVPAGNAQPTKAEIGNAAVGLEGVKNHTESAEYHVQEAKPHADAAGVTILDSATHEHQAVIQSYAAAKESLTAANTQVDVLAEKLAVSNKMYAAALDHWYVRWGVWIERALWIIGISWLALGIASIFFGMGNPLGWVMTASKEIVRFLPAMNIFAWVRDWINAWRGNTLVQANAASPVPAQVATAAGTLPTAAVSTAAPATVPAGAVVTTG